MRKIIKMRTNAGDFAENKDIARKIRIEKIMPALLKGDEVVLDFLDVQGATQSFIHALISDPIRELKNKAFDNLAYKNVNNNIKGLISIVYRYMQESLDIGENEG